MNQLQVMPAAMLACYRNQQSNQDAEQETYTEDYNGDYQGYRVIDPKTIKEKILDLLGAVLARCWLDKSLMSKLERDPHHCLYEMGLIMPTDLKLVVVRESKNRPQIVIYEDSKRICALQLKMTASV